MIFLLKQLWNDERGFVNSGELILIATLAVIGLIVGLAAFRDSLVQELGDTGAAIGQVNQSFDVHIAPNFQNNPQTAPVITVLGDTVTVQRAFTHGGGGPTIVHTLSSFNNYEYHDQPDIGDGDDVSGMVPPTVVSIGDAPIDEGEALAP